MDLVTVTPVPKICTVPTLRQASGSGAVWPKSIYWGLGMRGSGLTWSLAHEQLSRLGAHHGTAAETKVLRSLLRVEPTALDGLVISLQAACQWLRDAGQPEAAQQLSQQQQQALNAAACSSVPQQPSASSSPASQLDATAPKPLPPARNRPQVNEAGKQDPARRPEFRRVTRQVSIFATSIDLRFRPASVSWSMLLHPTPGSYDLWPQHETGPLSMCLGMQQLHRHAPHCNAVCHAAHSQCHGVRLTVTAVTAGASAAAAACAALQA